MIVLGFPAARSVLDRAALFRRLLPAAAHLRASALRDLGRLLAPVSRGSASAGSARVLAALRSPILGALLLLWRPRNSNGAPSHPGHAPAKVAGRHCASERQADPEAVARELGRCRARRCERSAGPSSAKRDPSPSGRCGSARGGRQSGGAGIACMTARKTSTTAATVRPTLSPAGSAPRMRPRDRRLREGAGLCSLRTREQCGLAQRVACRDRGMDRRRAQQLHLDLVDLIVAPLLGAGRQPADQEIAAARHGARAGAAGAGGASARPRRSAPSDRSRPRAAARPPAGPPRPARRPGARRRSRRSRAAAPRPSAARCACLIVRVCRGRAQDASVLGCRTHVRRQGRSRSARARHRPGADPVRRRRGRGRARPAVHADRVLRRLHRAGRRPRPAAAAPGQLARPTWWPSTGRRASPSSGCSASTTYAP